MTREEEAIKWFRESPFYHKDHEPFNMAIKALSQQTEYHGTEDMEGLYYCPICQQTTTVVKDGKCQKCGAIMDELSPREQTEDAISRKQAVYIASGFCHPSNIADELAKLPSVNPQPKTGHCKDCKYFEYNSVAKVDGIPLIVAHEICKRWGDGCKTSENGYCFMFEQQESEGKDGGV